MSEIKHLFYSLDDNNIRLTSCWLKDKNNKLWFSSLIDWVNCKKCMKTYDYFEYPD